MTTAALRKTGLALAGLFAAVTVTINVASAFVGPGNAGGVGSGAISSDAGNNVAINNATPLNTTKFSVYASSTSASSFALQVLQPGGSSIFSVRNDGLVNVPGAFSAGSFSGTINAGNVSAGTFGANTGNGNFTFPASLTASNIGAGGSTFGIYPLTVNGNIMIRGSDASTLYGFNGQSGAWFGSGDTNYIFASYRNALYFATNNSVVPSLGISPSGIAILKGTTAASYPLDVAGSIRSSTGGFVFPDGTTQVTASTGASTTSATNVSSGAFGANTGGGNYSFPGTLGLLGAASTATLSVNAPTGSKFFDAKVGGTPKIVFFSSDPTIGGNSMRLSNTDASIYDGNQLMIGANRIFFGYGTVDFNTAVSSGLGAGIYNGYLSIGNTTVRQDYYDSKAVASFTNNNGSVLMRSTLADGTNAIANYIDSYYSFSGSGAKLLSIRNAAVEKAYIDKDGLVSTVAGYRFPDGTTQVTAASSSTGIINAGNVSAGSFGANTGGGNYTFPGTLAVSGTGISSVAGSLGIGTLAPVAKLAINGGLSSDQIRVGDITSGFYYQIGRNTGPGTLDFNGTQTGFRGYAFNNAESFAVTDDSNVRLTVRGFGNNTLAGIALSGRTTTNGADWFIDNRGGAEAPNNRLAFFNNGGERLTLLDGGNVGVGNNNPSYKLDVTGSIRSAAGGFVFPDGTTQTTAASGSATINAGNVSAGTFGANTGNGNFTFPASLTASNIGAGGSTFGIYPLTVNGNIMIRGSDASTLYGFNGQSGAWFGSGDTNYIFASYRNALYFATNNSVVPSLGISPSGIAILKGTTAASYPLDVAGSIRSSTGGFVFPDGTTQTTASTGSATISAANVSSGSFGANTGGGNYTFPGTLTVSGTGNSSVGGNFGIGTASPGARLTVNGGTSSDQIRTGDMSSGYYFQIGRNTGSGTLDFNGTQSGARGYLFANAESFTVADDSNVRLAVTALGNNTLAGITLSGRTTTNGGDWFIDNRGGLDTPNNRLGFFNAGGERLTLLDGGNIGIGIGNPGYKLSVAGVIQSSTGGFRFPDGTTQITAASGGGTISATNVSAGAFGANTGGGNYSFPNNLSATANINASGLVSASANTSIGTHPTYGSGFSGFWRTGSDYALLTDGTHTYLNAPASGGSIFFRSANATNMTLAGTTLTIGGGTGKINVGTIDPVYQIGDERFATYMAGMIGVKEEVAGTLALPCVGTSCSMTIDFASEPHGSDLWLFGKTTDIRKHLPQASVLLTPAFEGRVSYEKGDGTITLKATSFKPQDEVEVSYRLTAPRFDADQWSNRTDDDAKGFVLPE